MKIVTIVGARPQFIKASPVSTALREAGIDEYLVHTGQHYDYGMSQVFFDEMEIPYPEVNLDVGSGSHGSQTGQMLIEIEKILLAQKPDWVVVYGDTNSTLAGALAAIKLHIPVAHIEAGLRSFNREMPEEHNRVLTDHCADILFCPTQTGVDNLAKEGVTQGVHLVGDTMYDAVLAFSDIARQKSTILEHLNLEPKQYLLATIHRPYNTDDIDKLGSILRTLIDLDEMIVFPVHPRTRNKLSALEREYFSDQQANKIKLIDPVGYLDILTLQQNARIILTDSGGMQKEAYFFGVPCITLRPETEWVETVDAGWNVLAGKRLNMIYSLVHEHSWPTGKLTPIFGMGDAAQVIVKVVQSVS